MGDFETVSSSPGGALAALQRFAKMTDPEEHRAMLEDAGHFMAFTVVPQRFSQGGPDPEGNPFVSNARGGTPLRDHGLMMVANDFEVRGDTLAVGNSRIQSRLQNRGGPLMGQKPQGARGFGAGGSMRAAEAKAFSHYQKEYNPKAASGSLGWMYVKRRQFLYFGEYAFRRIVERWQKRWGMET